MTVLMDGGEITRAINTLANAIYERHADDRIMLLGIQRRGSDIALRIAKQLRARGAMVSIGSLDINLYRDDWTRLAQGAPFVNGSHLPESPDGRTVILVDDVLFSGRTIRAALEAVLDYGRPERIELVVLVDRGHRELPIAADYTGACFKTGHEQHVDVLLEERDGKDAVLLR